MNERRSDNRQSFEELSALMDGEASELELRRSLKALDTDPEMLQKWRRYQISRSVLQADVRGADVTRFAQLDISAAVTAAVANESAHTDSVSSTNRWQQVLKPLSNVAVAASVAAMVVFGWQYMEAPGEGANGSELANNVALSNPPTLVNHNGLNQSAGVIGNTRSTLASQQSVVQPFVGQRVSVPGGGYQVVSGGNHAPLAGVAVKSVPIQGGAEIIRMSPAMNQRLNQYFISHSGNAALNTASGAMSYTRVINFEP